jgi:antitoxin ParD1/3/4
MNISLTEHYQKFIEEKVKSGKYYSASEVVRSALRLMEEVEMVRETETEYYRKAIEEGLKSGEPKPINAESFLVEAKEKSGLK